jgi:hypothetical protein
MMALGSLVQAVAEESSADVQRRYEQQKARTDELERRLRLLEEAAEQERYVATESVPEATLSFLTDTEISGLISASWLYNFNEPSSRDNAGRGFDNRHNEFMLNKAAVFIGKSLDYDAFEWLVGYDVKLLLGEDAGFTQTDLNLGDYGDLFEANVVINVPVGNGVQVLFGKCGTPIGYESSFTEENYNWSGGLQWTFVEPFTHTGIKATYAVNSEWEVELYAFNGWDIVHDNNDAKSFIGHVTHTPREATTLSLIGYAGPEQDDNNSNWRRGVDFYVEQKLTPCLTGVVQGDYGVEAGAAGDGGTADWWAAGLWLVYEASDLWSVALRGDYLNDADGARTFDWFAPEPEAEDAETAEESAPDSSDSEAAAPYAGTDLYSLTLTLNWKPVEALRVAPEVRWDHCTSGDVFDGKSDQVTLGMGVACFF